MRKHLYKAKRTDNREWVYGYYMYQEEEDKHIIVDTTRCVIGFGMQVDKETVCEYVKDDCKGNQVFENDIVKFEYCDLDMGTVKEKGIIVWHNDSASYLIYVPYFVKYFDIGFHEEMEVMGNEFDNGKL